VLPSVGQLCVCMREVLWGRQERAVRREVLWGRQERATDACTNRCEFCRWARTLGQLWLIPAALNRVDSNRASPLSCCARMHACM
jgi:hypothetical protein